jgi:hypothetical protein
MRRENPIEILTEDIDEKILARMPEWLKRLREAYKK